MSPSTGGPILVVEANGRLQKAPQASSAGLEDPPDQAFFALERLVALPQSTRCSRSPRWALDAVAIAGGTVRPSGERPLPMDSAFGAPWV